MWNMYGVFNFINYIKYKSFLRFYPVFLTRSLCGFDKICRNRNELMSWILIQIIFLLLGFVFCVLFFGFRMRTSGLWIACSSRSNRGRVQGGAELKNNSFRCRNIWSNRNAEKTCLLVYKLSDISANIALYFIN